MNKVILTGRLTSDPEVGYTTGGNASTYVRFSLAVSRRYKNSEGNYDADFIRCVAWRGQAEFIKKYFHKGDMTAIEGNIHTGSFTNKDGQKVYTTEVWVDNVEFCGSKGSGGNVQAPAQQNSSRNTDFINVPDTGSEEPLPF